MKLCVSTNKMCPSPPANINCHKSECEFPNVMMSRQAKSYVRRQLISRLVVKCFYSSEPIPSTSGWSTIKQILFQSTYYKLTIFFYYVYIYFLPLNTHFMRLKHSKPSLSEFFIQIIIFRFNYYSHPTHGDENSSKPSLNKITAQHSCEVHLNFPSKNVIRLGSEM